MLQTKKYIRLIWLIELVQLTELIELIQLINQPDGYPRGRDQLVNHPT
jgi:hypothetical protein